MWVRLIVCSVLLLLGNQLRAEVTLSFPLEGHYRTGRYMPVRVVGSQAGEISIRARGAVPTVVRMHSSGDWVVPWLAVSEVHGEYWHVPGDNIARSLDVNLRPLGDDDRLVGLAGDAGDGVEGLFPGKHVIPVLLNASPRLLDPPVAWEALDAVVLSASMAAQVSEAQRDVLLAGGTLIAIRGVERPDALRPWKQWGDYWVIGPAIAGPSELILPTAYEPTYAWDRGWPESFRRQIVLFTILFSLLLTAGALMRSRLAVAVVIGVAVAGGVGIGVWYSMQSPVLRLSVGVAVQHNGMTQIDRWEWRSPVRPADISVTPAAEDARPVFASPNQVDQVGIRLFADTAGGQLTYRFHLDPLQSLAFRERTLLRDWNAPPLSEPTPVMRSFAENLYAGGPISIAGEFTSAGQHVVVLRDTRDSR